MPKDITEGSKLYHMICAGLINKDLTSEEARVNLKETYMLMSKSQIHEILQLIYEVEDDEALVYETD